MSYDNLVLRIAEYWNWFISGVTRFNISTFCSITAVMPEDMEREALLLLNQHCRPHNRGRGCSTALGLWHNMDIQATWKEWILGQLAVSWLSNSPKWVCHFHFKSILWVWESDSIKWSGTNLYLNGTLHSITVQLLSLPLVDITNESYWDVNSLWLLFSMFVSVCLCTRAW